MSTLYVSYFKLGKFGIIIILLSCPFTILVRDFNVAKKPLFFKIKGLTKLKVTFIFIGFIFILHFIKSLKRTLKHIRDIHQGVVFQLGLLLLYLERRFYSFPHRSIQNQRHLNFVFDALDYRNAQSV